jgi:hypothetical protein
MTDQTLKAAPLSISLGYGAVITQGNREVAKVGNLMEAERLAACWNVCDGISTSVLELNATAGGVANLERQRDALLAALKKLNSRFCSNIDAGAVATDIDFELVAEIGVVLASIKDLKPAEPPSYHDVVVFAGDQRLRLFDCSYGLQLQCTRSAGWELWNVWDGKEEFLAGEYSSKPLRIEVRGVVICETKPSEGDDK